MDAMTLLDRELTPQEQAILLHLQAHGFKSTGPTLLRTCVEAIAIGQQAANGEEDLLDRGMDVPYGSGIPVPVREVITFLHLNSFIDWGGGEIE